MQKKKKKLPSNTQMKFLARVRSDSIDILNANTLIMCVRERNIKLVLAHRFVECQMCVCDERVKY